VASSREEGPVGAKGDTTDAAEALNPDSSPDCSRLDHREAWENLNRRIDMYRRALELLREIARRRDTKEGHTTG
jgi:hypothetical protein